MPAVLETFEHDSGDIKALRSQYIYVLQKMYIVDDNAGILDIDFGREGL